MMMAQLKKGLLGFCVLLLIEQGEWYGYPIMKQITTLFPDTREATVYSVLRRLLAQGYVTCYPKAPQTGEPPRQYYALSAQGKNYLDSCKTEWYVLSDKMGGLLGEKI